MTENNNFRMGLRDGLPICLGYFAVSFAFGIYSVASGLSILEAVMISAFNLTSAGQYAAVPIIAAGGSFIELGLTQLVINARYALMSVSLSQKLGKSIRLKERFLFAFANTDEIFAVSVSNMVPVGRQYMLGLVFPPFLGWTIGTLAGAVAGNVLPRMVVCSLEIAIYAMFIAIVIPAAKDNRGVALAVLISIGLSCMFYFVPLLNTVSSGFSVIIIAVLVSLLMAFIAPLPDEEVGEEVPDA